MKLPALLHVIIVLLLCLFDNWGKYINNVLVAVLIRPVRWIETVRVWRELGVRRCGLVHGVRLLLIFFMVENFFVDPAD